jgi:hypothetical protein
MGGNMMSQMQYPMDMNYNPNQGMFNPYFNMMGSNLGGMQYNPNQGNVEFDPNNPNSQQQFMGIIFIFNFRLSDVADANVWWWHE